MLASSVKNLPFVASSTSLSVVQALTALFKASPCLNSSFAKSSWWPRRALIQPFSEKMTVIGSFSTSAAARSRSISGASANVDRRRPSGVFFENFSRVSFTSSATRSHCRSSDLRSCLSSRRSFESLSCSARISTSSSLRKRSQSQVQDGFRLHVRELELRDQLGLWIILAADDANDLVDVEVGNEVAVEDFKPLLDLVETKRRAANEDFDSVFEPLRKHIAQRQHVRKLSR